jgi:pyruvate/2-oxoacid:ferredoxin oxidoreductase alpha subunit
MDPSTEEPPPDLSHAGAVVDQAIDYMMNHNIGSLEIASALLGGAIGIMGRSMSPDQVVRVLENAIAATRRGDV